jgi:hypothetical protein
MLVEAPATTLNRTLLAAMRRRQTLVMVVLAIAIVGAIVASAAGWLGGVVVCGADRAPGCVTWPMPISELIWAGFVVGVAALLIWQLRT